jgi:hypothetical protein
MNKTFGLSLGYLLSNVIITLLSLPSDLYEKIGLVSLALFGAASFFVSISPSVLVPVLIVNLFLLSKGSKRYRRLLVIISVFLAIFEILNFYSSAMEHTRGSFVGLSVAACCVASQLEVTSPKYAAPNKRLRFIINLVSCLLIFEIFRFYSGGFSSVLDLVPLAFFIPIGWMVASRHFISPSLKWNKLLQFTISLAALLVAYISGSLSLSYAFTWVNSKEINSSQAAGDINLLLASTLGLLSFVAISTIQEHRDKRILGLSKPAQVG